MRGIKLAKLNFDPHLTIGKKLSSNQFLAAIETFSKKQYQKKFLCTHLTLLRHSYDYRNEREFWMKVSEIPLRKPLMDVDIAA
jgi:2'-5' RNA ligase